ncbi:MAG: LamG domain-containing protein [Thermodesulfobacteriota bacterium]
MAVIALMLVSVIAYAGSVTYTYDSLNRLIKAEYEDMTVIQYSYDSAGNRTATYDKAIPPITTADPPGGMYYSPRSVTLTCNDFSGFGCDKTYYTTDGTTPTTSSSQYSSPINISVTTTLKFFSTDLASNSETVKTQNYTIDTTPPTGTITINSGAATTNNLNVTLALTCEDAQGCSQMKFSNDDVDYSTPETYSSTKTWTLTSGTGTKTVYARFKDTEGNWSAAYSDTIELIAGSYTKSLLHMNGADTSTTFTDSAADGTHTWTASGNAQIDTAQYKFGGASGLFDGNGDFISTPDSSDFDFGSGEFTVDFWIKAVNPPAQGGGHQIIAFYGSEWSSNNWQWLLRINHNAGSDEHRMIAEVNDGGTTRKLVSNAALSFTSWVHVALVRSSNDLFLFINGVKQTSQYSGLGTLTDPAGTCYCKIADAMWSTYHYYFNGGVDEFRVSKGIARWTSNFTPPSAEY